MTIQEVIKAQFEGKKVEPVIICDKETGITSHRTSQGETMVYGKVLGFDFQIVED